MKNIILFCFASAIAFISCRTEKNITRNGSILPVDKNTRISSGFAEQPAKGEPNRAIAALNIKKELDIYNISMVPDPTVLPWRDYHRSYNAIENKLSAATLTYCKKTLLEVYEIYKDNVQPTEMMNTFSLLKEFIDKKYGGYKVIYNYLKWFKESGLFNDQWKALQAKVAGYAVASKPDPSKPDSEIFSTNPEFKAEMLRMIELMKERDSYIEKIKAL